MLPDKGRSTRVDKAGNRREAVRSRNRSQAVSPGRRERDPKDFPRSLGTREGRPGALRPQRQTTGPLDGLLGTSDHIPVLERE